MRTLRLLFKHEMIALEPNGFNSDSSSATVVLKMVCQSLVKIDHDGAVAPDLALSWEISPDQRTFRFTLDPDARFHTGRPCDAEAVAWNFRRLMHRRSDSLLVDDYAGLEDVLVIASDCVEFRFKEPKTSFLRNLGWRTYVVDDCFEQPAGTGPFALVEWIRGSHVLLRRVTRKDTDTFDLVRIDFAPSAEQRIALIEAGAVDIIENVPAGAAPGLVARGLLETQAAPSHTKSLLNFNCRIPPFDDPRVRAAVAHAVDRETLIKTVTGGGGRLVDGIIPRGDPLAVDLPPVEFDPDRSRALLKEAGLSGGIRIKAAATNVAPMPKIVELITADLAKIGISVDTTGYDDPPWWPYVYFIGPWQMAFQGNPGRPHPDNLFSRELRTGGAFNVGGYSNPALDTIVDQARVTLDAAQQSALYGEAQRIVRRELPVFVLFASNVFVGWRPGVRGFRPHPLGVIDVSNVVLD